MLTGKTPSRPNAGYLLLLDRRRLLGCCSAARASCAARSFAIRIAKVRFDGKSDTHDAIERLRGLLWIVGGTVTGALAGSAGG